MPEPKETAPKEGAERLARESSLPPGGQTASADSTSESPEGPLGNKDDSDRRQAG